MNTVKFTIISVPPGLLIDLNNWFPDATQHELYALLTSYVKAASRNRFVAFIFTRSENISEKVKQAPCQMLSLSIEKPQTEVKAFRKLISRLFADLLWQSAWQYSGLNREFKGNSWAMWNERSQNKFRWTAHFHFRYVKIRANTQLY